MQAALRLFARMSVPLANRADSSSGVDSGRAPTNPCTCQRKFQRATLELVMKLKSSVFLAENIRVFLKKFGMICVHPKLRRAVQRSMLPSRGALVHQVRLHRLRLGSGAQGDEVTYEDRDHRGRKRRPRNHAP